MTNLFFQCLGLNAQSYSWVLSFYPSHYLSLNLIGYLQIIYRSWSFLPNSTNSTLVQAIFIPLLDCGKHLLVGLPLSKRLFSTKYTEETFLKCKSDQVTFLSQCLPISLRIKGKIITVTCKALKSTSHTDMYYICQKQHKGGQREQSCYWAKEMITDGKVIIITMCWWVYNMNKCNIV